MSIADQLACALGRNDEAPNVALAVKISKGGDKKALNELISLLENKKSAIRSDAIKVVYEIAARVPELVIPYSEKILEYLHHKDNRMKWGAMTALSAISESNPGILADHLTEIVGVMEQGSVITRDHGIVILCRISTIKKHHDDCMALLLEQIENAPVNQVPMYAEKIVEVISPPYLRKLERVLRARKDVLDIPSKQKRIEKLLKKIV